MNIERFVKQDNLIRNLKSTFSWDLLNAGYRTVSVHDLIFYVHPDYYELAEKHSHNITEFMFWLANQQEQWIAFKI